MTTTDSALRIDATTQLRDGRTLGYVEYGDPAGRPLLFCHGYPGARVEARFLAAAATKAGVRLVGVDRPGMGRSSFKPRRRFLDWPDEVAELADRLGLNRFAVVGFSGGGPYAAACAYKLPQRLTTCGIVAGAWPVGLHLYLLSRVMPWVLMPLMHRMLRNEVEARKTLLRMAQKWIEPDRRSLRPEVADLMTASLTEAFRQGARSAAYEATLLGGLWGFRLEEIAVPVHLWHGELDCEAPIAMGRLVAARLPQCSATYYVNNGHISLIANHTDEIVMALAA